MKYTPRQIDKEIDMFFRDMVFTTLLLLCVGLASCQSGQDAIPGPMESMTQGMDYLGTWALNDTENQLFNIVVRPDRTVVSNWSKGSRGAEGERGAWKRTGHRLIISYKDGWTDILSPSRYGISRQSYSPGRRWAILSAASVQRFEWRIPWLISAACSRSERRGVRVASIERTCVQIRCGVEQNRSRRGSDTGYMDAG